MATKKTTFADLKEKITKLEQQLDLAQAMGNADTVTKFQLIGWSAAALVVGATIGAILF